jgi:hydroxyacylglutathione hydrolase
MKSNILTSFLILFLWIHASAQVFKNKDLTITKLESNMWIVETTDNTTMYIIEGKEKAMLIDTGTKCEKLDSIIKLITKKLLYVVITHAHGDHDGNIRFFNEIYLHRADTVLLDKSYKGKVNFVKDGDKFDLGGTIIEVAHMPAHTPGSIVLLDKKDGICYSGDAFGSGQVWLQLKPLSPMKTYIRSCEKMEKLMKNGIFRIYCGHYPYPKKAFNKQYINDMLSLAKGLVNGNAPKAIPHTQIVSNGCENPMMVTQGEATIVFDPEHIN